MIDVHCHLEQKDYEKDRDQVIEKCRKELKAVITSCAHPKDFNLTIQLTEKHKGFVFATAGIHPDYIKTLNDKEIENYLELIKENKNKIVSIGEIGLDFWHEKDSKWQEKQRDLFKKMIGFAKEINKSITVHSRSAGKEVIKILEQEDAKKVHLHMFEENKMANIVMENGWFVSLNTMIAKSKKFKKVARDINLENIMTETDSPWLDPHGGRNTSLNIKYIIENLSKIKKISLEEIDKITTNNAIAFFDLPI